MFKRSFQGSVAEILTELFQNAQRVQASKVDLAWNLLVDATEESKAVFQFEYQDDGPGLKGREGFEALLCIALSDWDPSVVQNQQPMGIGFQALLAHEHVHSVTVASGGYQLEIDAKRWWDDEAYARSWPERLVASPRHSFGFKAQVTPEFVNDLARQLPTNPEAVYGQQTPAMGFDEHLAVYAQGERCVQGLPKVLQNAQVLTSVVLEDGNELTLFLEPDGAYGHLHCNWYGQLLATTLYDGIAGIRALLRVRSGAPVDLVAPSRRAFIENDKFKALKALIRSTLHEFVRTAARSQVTPVVLKAAYKAIEYGETIELQYVLLRPIGGGESVVVAKSELGLYQVLAPHVYVADADYGSMYGYGLESFVKALELRAFELEQGPSTAVNKRVWWKPGSPVDDKRMAHMPFQVRVPGQYQLQATTEDALTIPEKGWKRLPAQASVFAAKRRVYNDLSDAGLVLGSKDPAVFLSSNAEKLLEPETVDIEIERQQRLFKERVGKLERVLMGKALARNFVYADLQALFPEQADPVIVNVRFCFENGDGWPTHATVVPLEGKRVKARLHG